ncbi:MULTISPECIES: HD-GYP domain-containing protein [unclassified Aureimonas]|uniref:HD-GYP domain-containing protein n=1 Tax=unclassified Aureimonas TaxID=2615206 RepID=UPI0006FBF76C|nr:MULTISPECIES: HD domain-containing phosphohydrolase [unclassified Aureimonas]KQT58545.1 hypothetical protein ASG62_24625 [Aureimonas sp. Leaf427]KQT65150.1 hypothetical protein ASG54_22700 [Aureimonas sp. Leaf460]
MTETKTTVLLVEDNRTNLLLMRKLVERAGTFEAVCFSDPVEAAASLRSVRFDMAVVDHQMPGMSGIELIGRIRADSRNADKPLVMVTADGDSELRLAALRAGAVEFLSKPIDPVEFSARIANLGRLCEAQRKLADRAEWLRSEVEAATAKLRRHEEEIIRRLALTAGYKDDDTAAHTVRMARMCGDIARQLGLPADECRDIELAAPMHDIGKVGIRDDVLQKRGRLEDAEMCHMREHSRIGGDILGGSESDLLRLASTIATTHHERWDGTGYPAGLSGAAIPLPGRIAAVADVFDALVSNRPYKNAWIREDAIAYIADQAGRHFDPVCVTAFLAVVGRERSSIDAETQAAQVRTSARACPTESLRHRGERDHGGELHRLQEMTR